MNKVTKPKSFLFLKIIGYIAVFPGLMFLAVGIAGFFEPPGEEVKNQILGGLLFGGLTTIAGGLILLSAYQKSKKSKINYYEDLIFALGKEKNGILTAIELCTETKITRTEAEKLLGDCVTKGIASAEANNKGYVEYVFPVFLKE